MRTEEQWAIWTAARDANAMLIDLIRRDAISPERWTLISALLSANAVIDYCRNLPKDRIP